MVIKKIIEKYREKAYNRTCVRQIGTGEKGW